MKKYTLNTFLFFLTINLLSSQNLDSLYVSRVNDTILSKYLNEKRAIEIQLPRSYETEVDKNYPLMIVLDGDYMFNIVSGSVDYLSYWGDIPENLVVGINQKDTRFQDSSVFDNITFTPISSTASFYDFIVNELIPYFSKNYRVSNFKVIVGQERTANFANFFSTTIIWKVDNKCENSGCSRINSVLILFNSSKYSLASSFLLFS